MYKKLFFLIAFFYLISYSTAVEFYWNFSSHDDFFNQNEYPVEYKNIDFLGDFLSVSSEIETYGFLWVANSAESTVSKIDTRKNIEVARYRTGKDGVKNSPSRTTVDIFGNLWVGNREGDRNVIKIANKLEDCVDRDGDGINTSKGSGNLLSWTDSGPKDDCILFSKRHWSGTGTGPRSLTSDIYGNIWLGAYQDNKYYKLNHENGNLVFSVTNNNPYGSVIDRKGILWSANRGATGSISSINTLTGEHYGYINNFVHVPEALVPAPSTSSPYGITVNKFNEVFFTNAPISGNTQLAGGGFGYVDENKLITIPQSVFDPADSEERWFRGITSDDEGNIWFTSHRINSGMSPKIYKIDRVTKQVICTQSNFGVYREPIGILLDGDQNMWAIFSFISPSNQQGAAFKIDNNCNVIASVPLGLRPYTYSDATGATIQQFIDEGWWKVTIFSSDKQPVNWSNITWTASNPGNGAIINVSLNFSEDKGGFYSYEDQIVNNKQYFYDLSSYTSTNLTLLVKLKKNGDNLSPTLNKITIIANRTSITIPITDPDDDDPTDPTFPDPPGGGGSVVPVDLCNIEYMRTECSEDSDFKYDVYMNVTWLGNPDDKPDTCVEKYEIVLSGISCDMLELSFFSTFSLITSILVFIVIYIIIKKKSSNPKFLRNPIFHQGQIRYDL
jgi:large repetitive protein